MSSVKSLFTLDPTHVKGQVVYMFSCLQYCSKALGSWPSTTLALPLFESVSLLPQFAARLLRPREGAASWRRPKRCLTCALTTDFGRSHQAPGGWSSTRGLSLLHQIEMDLALT